MYCSTLCPAALSCFPFFALFLMFSLVIQFSSDLLYVMLFCVVLCCVVLCCAVLCCAVSPYNCSNLEVLLELSLVLTGQLFMLLLELAD